MSLVVAWSRTQTMANEADAVLQYALFRLELEGHTTMIIGAGADDETALVHTADAVVLFTDNSDELGNDFFLQTAPADVPLLLLLAEKPCASLADFIAGYRSFCAHVDLSDLRMSDCGADFVGATRDRLRTAIKAIAADLLQAPAGVKRNVF